MTINQSCRTCKWLEVPPNAAGKRRTRKGNAYLCNWPLPEMPALPDAITSHYGYREWQKRGRNYMGPDDGIHCPTYERHKP